MCPLRKDCGKGDVSQSSLWGQIQIILFAKAESLKRKEERVRIFSNQFYSEASMESWRMLFQWSSRGSDRSRASKALGVHFQE